jgi:YgiT-type zinc finger domain-containing protein
MPKAKRSNRSPAQTCSFCGEKAAHEILRSRSFGRGRKLIVIEDIPTMECSNCHETYYTGGTLKILDSLLSNPARITEVKEIPVAKFAA